MHDVGKKLLNDESLEVKVVISRIFKKNLKLLLKLFFQKKNVKWQSFRTECCDFTKQFSSTTFDKKNDINESERKIWKLTVCVRQMLLLIAIFNVVTRNFCKHFVSKILFFYSNNSLHNFSCGSSFLLNQVSFLRII